LMVEGILVMLHVLRKTRHLLMLPLYLLFSPDFCGLRTPLHRYAMGHTAVTLTIFGHARPCVLL